MNKVNNTEKIFNTDPDLKIKEEYLSIHALNPFVAQTSSARSYMFSSHLSQCLVLNNGEEKIIQTGLEKKLGENTISSIAEDDVRVLKVINRYGGIDDTSVKDIVETIVLVENLQTNEIDYISIPYYNKYHNYFGFKYRKNEELLRSIRTNDILPKGTLFATPPTIVNNGGYAFGVNANLCLLNLPETTEDGVIISKRLADKLNYSIFETRVMEFGTKYMPLNLYGDDEHYKAFPEIGELVNEDSVIMALREYNDTSGASLFSVKDIRDFNPIFDKAVYLKGPGEEIEISGEKKLTGKVVDIKVYVNPKYIKEEFEGINNVVMKYANALKRYYKEILDTYQELKNEHYERFKDYNLPISGKLGILIKDALAVYNPTNSKIRYTNKNEEVDKYRVEITVEYTMNVGVSNKLTDFYGSKGVIVQVRENEDMPYTIIDGEKIMADVVMDPSSITSRMNVGRIYEQYFNAISRTTQRKMRQILNHKSVYESKDSEVLEAYNILLGLLEIIHTEQLTEYKSIHDIETIRAIVEECITKEVYLLYKVSSEKSPYQICCDVKGTIYEPHVSQVYIKKDNKKVFKVKNPVLIAPIYTILLSKTGDTSLSVGSAKVNHYGVPIGVSNSIKNNLPWRNSPTKILSETETRLYLCYGSRYAIAEMKDRANSNVTHENIYKNILDADQPTNVDYIVDRNKVPYTDDVTLELINNIFNGFGVSIDYI